MTWQARDLFRTDSRTVRDGHRRHRRVIRCLRGGGAVILAAGLFAAAASPGMPQAAAAPAAPANVATTAISQAFALPDEAALDGWSIGTVDPDGVVGSIIDPATGGWLALTRATAPAAPGSLPGAAADQSGYAIVDQAVPSAGLTVEFTYADTGGGALALMLLNAPVTTPGPVPAAADPVVAATGLIDSLEGRSTPVVGSLPLVAIGLDEAGAFSLPAAADPASGPGSAPGSVVIRGGGVGTPGLPYTAGQTLATAPGVPAGTAVDGVAEASAGRSVRVVFGAHGLQVSMLFGSTWIPVLGPVAMPGLPPAGLVKVGFAAVSSAGGTSGGQHDIRDIVITPAPAPGAPVTIGPVAPVSTTTTTLAPTTTVAPTTTTTVAPTTTTVAPTTTTSVAPMTAAPTARPMSPSALAGPSVRAKPPLSAAAPWAGVSGRVAESGGLHDVGRATAGLVAAAGQIPTAQVSATGPIGVSVTARTSAPGSSVDVPITFTNTSTAPLTADMKAIVRPPDGVTLRPGATLAAGCTAVSSVLLNCTIPVAQLPAGGSVTLQIPFAVATSTPTGTSLPNGAVIVSVGTSASTEAPFALNMTTAGTPVATTTATTVAGTTATTLPGSLAFTGVPVRTTANRALLLIGLGVLLVLISLAWRPHHDRAIGARGPTPR